MDWHDRLNAALKDRNWGVPDLARAMGYPDDEAVLNRLYKYTAGDVQNPRGNWMGLIAEALDMSEADLRHGVSLTTPQSSRGNSANLVGAAGTTSHNARIGGSVADFSRVPIRGQAMGGKDGALTFNTDQNMGDILAPPILNGVPGAYAVYVVGDSMLERYRHGEVVFVHPFQPYRKDDDVVVQIAMGDGEPPCGWVKRFVSMDSKTLKVRQLNPKKILTFKRGMVISIHKIVMGGPV